MTDHVYKRLDELDLHDGDVVMSKYEFVYCVRLLVGKWVDQYEEPINAVDPIWRVIYRADAPVQQSAEEQPAMTQAQLERMKMRLDIAMRATEYDLKQYHDLRCYAARVAFADDMLKALRWSE